MSTPPSSSAECPKCHSRSMVKDSPTVWKCLNCDFSRDFSPPEKPPEKPPVLAGVLGGIGGALFLLLI